MDPKPHPGDQWDFFIAHASADRELAEQLYDVLTSDSRTFLDSRCLVPGDNWDTELIKAQRNSLITVVLISKNTGEAYYEGEEIATAIEMSRGEDKRHRVVPVLLEAVPS